MNILKLLISNTININITYREKLFGFLNNKSVKGSCEQNLRSKALMQLVIE